MRRKAIPKSIRVQIYESTDGCCAYCGHKIKLAEMQVDHIKPLYLGGDDNVLNYAPACRMCNHYKSTMTLEKFREQIRSIPDRLEKVYIYRLAKRYGLVVSINKEVEFFNEKIMPEE